jgi:hypothetical protein
MFVGGSFSYKAAGIPGTPSLNQRSILSVFKAQLHGTSV